MIRRILLTAVMAAFLSNAALAMADDVFVTAKGAKYHKEDCRLIKSRETSKLDEEDAVEKGYNPCLKCFKDEAASAKQESNSKKAK